MTDREQINLKLKSEKAGKWERHQEENPEYSSLTDLIRQSVEKEIAGSDTPTDNAQTGKEIAEIKEAINGLSGDIDMLTSAVSDIQGQIRSNPPEKHLRSEILMALPTPDSQKPKMTPEEVAKELGPVDEKVVSNVLERMADDVNVVQRSFEPDDTIKYWKKD